MKTSIWTRKKRTRSAASAARYPDLCGKCKTRHARIVSPYGSDYGDFNRCYDCHKEELDEIRDNYRRNKNNFYLNIEPRKKVYEALASYHFSDPQDIAVYTIMNADLSFGERVSMLDEYVKSTNNGK